MFKRYSGLTVGELRKRIDGLDDDMPVVMPSQDHSYRELFSTEVIDVVVSQDGYMTEPDCLGDPTLSDGESIVSALLVG